MGRPTKYTPEVVDRILDALQLGASRTMAVQAAGISYDSFLVYLEKYPDFLERVKEAESTGAVKWLAVIERAALEGAWQAAAWKLERRYPQEFGRTIQEHTGPNGSALTIVIGERPDGPQ